MVTRRKTKRSVSKASVAPRASMSAASCSTMGSCWDNHALAYALAAIMAAKVLVVSVLGFMGYAQGWVTMLSSYLMSYSSTLLGTVAGMAEAALYGLVCGFVLSWFYNRFSA